MFFQPFFLFFAVQTMLFVVHLMIPKGKVPNNLERIGVMEQKAINITVLSVIGSILSVILEFSVYHFTNSIFALTALTILTSLLLSHIFLETSLSYETGFIFSAITMILSTVVIAFTYYNKINGLLVYQNNIHLCIFFHWLVPMLYSIFRCLLDKGPRFAAFSSYFWKASIIFAVYHVSILIYHTILDPITLPYAFTTASYSFVPFFSTATHIEDHIYMGTGIGELIIYFCKLYVLFAPIGFYASLILRDYDRKTALWVKSLLCLIIPLIFEVISYMQGTPLNIDAYLYHFFSIFFGILLLKIMDAIFIYITGCAFLYERNRYSFFL